MTIRRKILALAVVLLLIFGIVVAVSALLQRGILGEQAAYFTYGVPLRTHVADLDVLTDEYELIVLRLLRLSGAPREEIESVRARAGKVAEEMNDDIRIINAMLDAAISENDLPENIRLSFASVKGAVPYIQRSLDPFIKTGERVLQAIADGHADEARTLSLEFRKTEAAFGPDTAALRQKLADVSIAAGVSMTDSLKTIQFLNITLFMLAAFLGIGAGSLVSRDIVHGLRRLIDGTKDVEAGHFTVTVPSGGQDEVGELTMAFNRMVEEIRAREKIKDAFGKFVDPRIVAGLITNASGGANQADRQVVTVFFSDIAGFTSISEQLTATAIVSLLNHYFTSVTGLIRASNGVVDKYMGDGIMAFWAPPFSPGDSHAGAACLCALKQQEAIEAVNKELPNVLGLRRAAPSLRVRMGLASGEVVIGTIGSDVSKTYTVIGDTVNLASRLEGVNKVYGTGIIIPEETVRLARQEIETRELDLITVAGKTEPVRIYELLAPAGQLAPADADLPGEFAKGLAAYRAQDWDVAERQFQHCLEIRPGDAPANVFLERVAELRRQPPPAGWDGVWHMTKK